VSLSFQDEDLKWVEENIPTTVADVYVSRIRALHLSDFNGGIRIWCQTISKQISQYNRVEGIIITAGYIFVLNNIFMGTFQTVLSYKVLFGEKC
jgi:hypothetical protein